MMTTMVMYGINDSIASRAFNSFVVQSRRIKTKYSSSRNVCTTTREEFRTSMNDIVFISIRIRVQKKLIPISSFLKYT